MTMRDLQMAGLGALVLGAVAAAAYWGLGALEGDEPGIRVKNGGSIHIETVTGKGFSYDQQRNEFSTRGDTKGCMLVVVTGHSECEDVSQLTDAVWVDLLANDNSGVHSVVDGGGRIVVKRGKGWSQDSKNPKNQFLKYGGSQVRLSHVRAHGKGADGKSATIDCTLPVSDEGYKGVEVAITSQACQ